MYTFYTYHNPSNISLTVQSQIFQKFFQVFYIFLFHLSKIISSRTSGYSYSTHHDYEQRRKIEIITDSFPQTFNILKLCKVKTVYNKISVYYVLFECTAWRKYKTQWILLIWLKGPCNNKSRSNDFKIDIVTTNDHDQCERFVIHIQYDNSFN